MNSKDKSNINNLRQEISIVDVISNFVKLNKKGNNHIGLCPFHDDKHASLSVNESKKIYKCFSCNNAGDVFTFVKNFKHISYSQAILECCEIAGIKADEVKELKAFINYKNENEVYYKINEDAAKYFSMFLNNKENEHARQYLESRNINKDLIKKFGIGFAPNDKNLIIDLLNNKDDMVKGAKGYLLKDIEKAGISKLLDNGEYIPYFNNRVTFTIRDENDEIVGFSARTISNEEPKYINTPSTPIFQKNSILYNLNNVSKNYDTESVYILEGFMDVIALAKLNINNAIATMGVAFSKEHINTLSKLPNLKNVIICFDNDEAGKTSIEKTAELLIGKYNVYIVQYLSDKKDIDEIQIKDPDLALKTINNVISYQSFKIKRIIEKINLNNSVEKNTALVKIIDILNSFSNNIEMLGEIKNVAKILNVDESIIKDSLTLTNKRAKSSSSYNYKKYEVNDVILKKNNYKKWQYNEESITKLSEIEILKFSLVNRKYVDLFFNKCGRILDTDIKQMLNLIQDYYLNNLAIDHLEQSDLIKIFSDNKQLSQISIILNEIRNKNIKYFDSKVEQIIQTQIKNLRKIDQQKITQKILEDNEYSDEYIKLIQRMNKKD